MRSNLVNTDFEETPTIGGFTLKSETNSFDDTFTEACNLVSESCDMRLDPTSFAKSGTVQEIFKENLLSGFQNETVENYGELTTESEQERAQLANRIYNEVSSLYDNTVEELVKEAAEVGTLLPIKSLDLPLVITQHAKCLSKMVIDTEVSPSPVIKKQIERTYVVDKDSGNRYMYPQCFYNDEFKEIYKAGKGLPIKTTPVELPLFNYDVIANLTDSTMPKRERLTIKIEIDKAYLEDGTEIVLDKPIVVDLSSGAWIGGNIVNKKVTDASDAEVVVNDNLSGFMDFHNNKVTLTSASGQIKSVSFNGFLSNEKNERAVTWEYDRETVEWHIEDGFRTDIPYTMEYLKDSKALLNEDMYQKTYKNIVDILVQMEDSMSFDYLDEMYNKYKGVVLDPLNFNPFVCNRVFDCDSTIATTALPSEYIATQLKFEIDRFIIDIADTAKLEDLAFVIYGNPRYISLLDPNVNWVVRQGDSIGGVKLNFNYGVMTSGNTKIMVVSSMKINASTQQSLRLVPYPTTKDTITFKHYKYSTDIKTAANSAYRDPNLPGGSATYIVGTSRWTNEHIQGIQGDMAFDNADFIRITG